MESTALAEPDLARMPPLLRTGDKVRFVSPASAPERDAVFQSASILESWGLKIEFGEHAFGKVAYLAGTDEESASQTSTPRCVTQACGRSLRRAAGRVPTGSPTGWILRRLAATRNSWSASATSPFYISAYGNIAD